MPSSPDTTIALHAIRLGLIAQHPGDGHDEVIRRARETVRKTRARRKSRIEVYVSAKRTPFTDCITEGKGTRGKGANDDARPNR
jgi:hypothetical protein